MTYYKDLNFKKIKKFLFTIFISIICISCSKSILKLNPILFSTTETQVQTPEVVKKKYQDTIVHLDKLKEIARERKNSVKYYHWVFGYGSALLSTSTFSTQLAKKKMCIQTIISGLSAIFSTAVIFGKFEREHSRWSTLEELCENEKMNFKLKWTAEVENVTKWDKEVYVEFNNYIKNMVDRLELIQKSK